MLPLSLFEMARLRDEHRKAQALKKLQSQES
jgi:hypothetical protein